MINMKKFISIILLFINLSFAQTNIVSYLKKIDAGEAASIKAEAAELLKKSPADVNLIFLDALLTEDAVIANQKFLSLSQTNPIFAYADAVLYRIYSYYYAIGSYRTAETYLNELKNKFPESPYIKAADRTIPESDIETAPVVKEETKEEAGKYTIQAGAFLSKKNAEALLEELTGSGFLAEIKEKQVGGSNFFIVYVGSFADEASAKSLLEQLQTNYKIAGRIVSK